MHRLSAFIVLLLIPALQLQAESNLVDVQHYRAELRFEPSARTIEGTVLITLRNAAQNALASVDLDARRELQISSVSLGRTDLAFTHDNDLLTVTLLTPLQPDDTLTLTIQYSGSPVNEGGSSPWGGCHWGDFSYFMGVGFQAPSVSMMRYWLPSNDVPSDKASFDITFDVPAGQVVAGTGVLTEQQLTDDRARYRWVEDNPTATYLFTYAISDYAVIEDEWKGLPLRYYVPRSDSLKGSTYFTDVPGMLEAFTSYFGPYPFSKVGYCITPIGSMEHQTMVSYSQSLFQGLDRAATIAAHELSHQWWGDWVTCLDFRDTWLNEGFATFSEALYGEFLKGRDEYHTVAQSHARFYRDSYSNIEGVFPLYDFPRTPPSSNYPATIYYKGSAVLTMLRDVMGDDAFFEALRAYGTRHAFGSASTPDFQAVMEEFHASSLDWFFSEWVYEAGWPYYNVSRIYDSSDPDFRIRIEQIQDNTYPLFRMPIQISIIRGTGDTLSVRRWVEAEKNQDLVFPGVRNEDVTRYRFDPDDIVLKNIRYRTLDASGIPSRPSCLTLQALFPNPLTVSGKATLRIDVPVPTHALLRVIDALGREASADVETELAAGTQHVQLDTSNLPAGMYTVVVHGGESVSTVKLLVQ